MSFLQRLHHPEKYFRILFKWSLLGIIVGLIGGLVGTLFSYTLSFVTNVRTENSWLILLLPFGGLATIGLYRLFKMVGNRGTNEIIESILKNKPVKPLVAPAIFIATSITHLFGGSAGREGAALQLGGSIASFLSKIFRLNEQERTVLIMSGMSSVFAALFRTPLTATIFTMEFVSVGTIFSPAMLPCYLASFVASTLSGYLGVHEEAVEVNQMVSLASITSVQIIALAIAIGVLGIVMCGIFHYIEHKAHSLIPNMWIRIVVGAAVIVALTVLVGDDRYNGAGMNMALAAVGGSANWYDFALKMLFTAVTLAAGFKGGEIVPTFCIGATFGCVFGGLIGLDPGFAAALGIVGLFCAATNSPLAAIVLSVEMFECHNMHIFALVCVIVFVVSGNWGLYSSQSIQFSKARLKRKNVSDIQLDSLRDRNS